MSGQRKPKRRRRSSEVQKGSKGVNGNPVDVLPQVHLDVKPKTISIGHSRNINSRHSGQLKCLSALLSSAGQNPEVTDDKFQVLMKPECSNGLYLKWRTEDDSYLLWGSNVSKQSMIKFEFHGGLEPAASLLDAKNPLLLFSSLFDQNKIWGEVKDLLKELFGRSEEGAGNKHDYIFAFTRAGMMFQLKIFKLLDPLTPNVNNLKLKDVSSTFIFKPLEILRLSGTEDTFAEQKDSTDSFIDPRMLMFEGNNDLNLESCSVLYGKEYPDMVPHPVKLPDLYILMLPSPDFQRFGFNTSSDDFFERYLVYRSPQVRGTGPDPSPSINLASSSVVATIPASFYDQLSLPMKFYSRSLIGCVKDKIKMKLCFQDFTKDNIHLRGRTMKILGVEVLPYSDSQVEKNLRTVHTIIVERLGTMRVPDDVKAVLDLLYLGIDAVAQLDLIYNNVAWMDGLERNHLVVDLFEDYSEFLVADTQVQITQKFDGICNYENKFQHNWLIRANRNFTLSKKIKNLQDLLKDVAKKAKALQDDPPDRNIDSLSANNAHLMEELFKGRLYFGHIRHLYTHLSDTGRKKKSLAGLTSDEKDTVVSSEFAKALSDIQVEVPAAFAGLDDKKSSYGRFKRYFGEVDFSTEDQK